MEDEWSPGRQLARNNWSFLGSFSTWLRGQGMEEVIRNQAIVWSRRERLMTIPPHKAAKESTRNTEQHARRCRNGLDHVNVFCGGRRGKDRQKVKGEAGLFPSRSTAMQAVAGHGGCLWSFRPNRWRRCFNQEFYQVGFWLCVQIMKHELQKDNNVLSGITKLPGITSCKRKSNAICRCSPWLEATLTREQSKKQDRQGYQHYRPRQKLLGQLYCKYWIRM